MPVFFLEDQLTENQKARWDRAVIQYAIIQEANLERRMSKITKSERDFYAKNNDAHTDADIKAVMREFLSVMGNPPGHTKSALFARLLDGKEALEFPPPTNHSYPWYEVIEEPGPHRVMLGGAYAAQKLALGTWDGKTDLSISINQCTWTVRGLNAAAHQLLDLNIELQSLSRPEDPSNKNSSMVYDWSDDLLARVKAAYAAQPEFIVQHSDWPEFRLFVAQMDQDFHQSNKKYAKSKMNLAVRHLLHTYSVFDLDALNLNARIGKTISKGKHPRDRLEAAKARYEFAIANGASTGFTSKFEKDAVDKLMQSLEADVIEFEANPDNEDWVEAHLDMWYLEKKK
jgi:hypothetical protein